MLRYTSELRNLSTTLERSLKFGKDSFALAIEDFLEHIQKAEAYINVQGQKFVEDVTSELVNGILQQIHSYLNLVIEATSKNIGRCGPIANVYDSMTVATCNRIVDPFVRALSNLSNCKMFIFKLFLERILGRRRVVSRHLPADDRAVREAVHALPQVGSVPGPAGRIVSVTVPLLLPD